MTGQCCTGGGPSRRLARRLSRGAALGHSPVPAEMPVMPRRLAHGRHRRRHFGSRRGVPARSDPGRLGFHRGARRRADRPAPRLPAFATSPKRIWPRMNTDKTNSLLIRANPCPFVAHNVLPPREQRPSGSQDALLLSPSSEYLIHDAASRAASPGLSRIVRVCQSSS